MHSATWWTWLTWLTWLTCAFASLHWSNGDWAWWRIGETQKKRERQGIAQPEAAQTRTETTYQSQRWGGRHSWAGWEERQAGCGKDMNGNSFGQLYIVSVRMRQVRSVPLCFWLQCHGIAVSACLACFFFLPLFPRATGTGATRGRTLQRSNAKNAYHDCRSVQCPRRRRV